MGSGEKKLFSNMNLKIEKGDYVSIMGASGKGKTTLLNIIGMLERPDSGTVKIGNIKKPKFISKRTESLRRNEISYLFQNYGLIDSETVEENLNIAVHFKRYSKKQKK
jgi:putative ABC transport system ATP-binding protein